MEAVKRFFQRLVKAARLFGATMAEDDSADVHPPARLYVLRTPSEHRTKSRSGKVTVCTSCTHFLNKAPGSVNADAWYNHLCKASPLPTQIDPYDGLEKPFGVNDLGARYFTDEGFACCRDINDGACPKFAQRKMTMFG